MNLRTTGLIAAVLLAAHVAWADENTDRDIKYCQDRAAYAQQFYDDMANDLSPFAVSYAQVDLPMVKQDMDHAQSLWKDAAAKFEKGDPDAGRDLQRQAGQSLEHVDPWRNRVRARVQQARLAPTEEQFNQMAQNASPRVQPAIGALVESQKAASAAYGKLADAITPDADAKTVDALRDDAFTAEVKTELARFAVNWANDDDFRNSNSAVNSPELASQDEKIAANRKARSDAYLQFRLNQRKSDKLEDEYRRLIGPRNHLVDLARETAEKAKQQPN